MGMKQRLFLQHSTSGLPACGLKLKVVTNDGKEYLPTIGGLIRLENKIFGLTTAHGIMRDASLFSDSVPPGPDSSDPESSSASNTESESSASLDICSDSSIGSLSGLPTEYKVPFPESNTGKDQAFQWADVTSSGPMSFCGRGVENNNYVIYPHMNADFALIDIGLSPGHRLYNRIPVPVFGVVKIRSSAEGGVAIKSEPGSETVIQGIKHDKDLRS
ncbi:hypothetical protein K458DRAFT_386393 [Lentithecium fluviatile CBS 122367]|uniref:Uncharacterized protein n=1 Tax=Lentithecium fluviatile CBS 122367 TaxID=1168545 RepID=A0A6G1JBS0_9PLEO|nr:hypothetical protein K458DRAFT_386393 [Lentithecium fluviatile CBS 122367]